jgi:hypothetical protein
LHAKFLLQGLIGFCGGQHAKSNTQQTQLCEAVLPASELPKLVFTQVSKKPLLGCATTQWVVLLHTTSLPAGFLQQQQQQLLLLQRLAVPPLPPAVR